MSETLSPYGMALPAILDISKVHELKPSQVLSESPRSMVIVCEPKVPKWSKKLSTLIKKDFHEQSNDKCILKTGYTNGYVEKEASCLNKLGPHPNIVKLIDYFYSGKDNSLFSVLLERVPGDSVVNILMSEGPMKEPEAALVVNQVAKALSYLHSNNIVHRDVKPDNMIYNRSTGLVKLIDFEFAENFSKKPLTGAKGTGLYMAPEVRRGKIYKGPEIDVWALSVSLYVIVTASFPFTEPQIESGFLQLSPQQSAHFSIPLRDLFRQTLHLQATNRAPIEIFENHQWIKRGLRSEVISNLTLKIKSSNKKIEEK